MLMIFIGEVLPKNLSKELMKRFPNTRIINGYGPTEATVAISANDITSEMIEDLKSLPVGVVMDTSEVKIVDENGKEVADGEKGEIAIIGKSVSKGYFKNEEKTKKFSSMMNLMEKSVELIKQEIWLISRR